MKAIILAAGKGTRLRPLTDIAPKPLLPVYNKPMIFYPLLTLQEAGIEDVIIVADPNNVDEFKTFFGDGKKFGLKIQYAIQEEQLGIAHAISMTEKLVAGDDIIVIHGDNIIEDNIESLVEEFDKQSFSVDGKEVRGAKIALKKVEEPTRFGIAEIKDGQIIDIEEKPKEPKSELATVSPYFFDNRAFDIIRTLKPSGRGEYEISELADRYVKEGTMTHDELTGGWFDVGTIEALHEASEYIEKNPNLAEKNFEYIRDLMSDKK
jgi:glucose-1-phosphate thymidylyltransferase